MNFIKEVKLVDLTFQQQRLSLSDSIPFGESVEVFNLLHLLHLTQVMMMMIIGINHTSNNSEDDYDKDDDNDKDDDYDEDDYL